MEPHLFQDGCSVDSVFTINYYKRSSSKGKEYPDKLAFVDPEVDAERLGVTIPTNNTDKESKKFDD